jgi:hypothetical protein
VRWRCKPCREAGHDQVWFPATEHGEVLLKHHLDQVHGIRSEQVDVPVIKVAPATRLDRPHPGGPL